MIFNKFFCIVTILIIAPVFFSFPAYSQDMRMVRLETRQIEADMAAKAAQTLEEARAAAAQSRREITADRKRLDQAIADHKARIRALEAGVKTLSSEVDQLTQIDQKVSMELEAAQDTVKELTGVIRTTAKDVRSLVEESFLSGIHQPDTKFLEAAAQDGVLPGMKDIRAMSDLLFTQIEREGAVYTTPCGVVNRAGKAQESEVLVLGGYTAAYRTPEETGFLSYAQSEKKLFALSKLPPAAMQKSIQAYMDGRQESVPVDISGGGALNQLTHSLSLSHQVSKGGPIVWPILAILGLGGLITLERIFFILRRKIRLEKVWEKIEILTMKQAWEECVATCDQYKKNPVIRVIRSGINSRQFPREDMENAVQEAILKEIPPMERFLSTMGMLAGIAPLLGLLGTVTGMIDTFHVITMHGTGDPRMMSGGISEALVTTMLGLSVAIPIMLAHTLLTRTVENTVGLMEEKAVALINIVQKIKGA